PLKHLRNSKPDVSYTSMSVKRKNGGRTNSSYEQRNKSQIDPYALHMAQFARHVTTDLKVKISRETSKSRLMPSRLRIQSPVALQQHQCQRATPKHSSKYSIIYHCLRWSFVNTVGPTILGLPTCTDLNLITLNYSITTQSKELQPLCPKPPSARNAAAKENLIKRYGDCFERIGCFQGEFHITLDPSIPPVVHPRRVPEALREPLKKKLDSLVEQGIIAKVEQPTDWVNSLVCVTKSNGSLRLCLDPKDLNRAIKRPHHFTPTLDNFSLS
ncbi:Hypothetical predicted protein, partial [Paramuricea clavata]